MSNFENNSDAQGRRARLRPKPAAVQTILGGSNILRPLVETHGMVWPYQPNINYTQTVDYQQVSMVHTNQDFYAYTRSPTPEITCEGQFTVQNQTEGLYALACLHFLRVVTKMRFGASADPGVPPPVLLFDAYGKFMFNKLPVIISQFTSNMPNDVDYVPVDMRGLSYPPNLRPRGENSNLLGTSTSRFQLPNTQDGYTWLPAVFTISVSMKIQNTPKRLQTFDLDKFKSGDQLKGGGWI